MENNLLKKWYLRRIGNSVVACGEIYSVYRLDKENENG